MAGNMQSSIYALFAVLALLSTLHSEEPITLDVWPDGAPEKPGFVSKEELVTVKDDGLKRLSHVSKPTLTVYKPTTANGTAILVCPGGGYQGLAIEHEGTQVADYLNTIGVTAIVLKYRVPRRDPEKPHEAPLADAHKAMKLVRFHAIDWGIATDRIGMLGFSAGGHLCVMAALHLPQADKPNFIVPVYPAYLTVKDDAFTLRPDIVIPESTPPACFVHAGDDRITSMGSVLLYAEYKKQGIPAELHVYSEGGHGFGMKAKGQPINQWHRRVAEWLDASGWLGE